jgi:hypothetical protein|tara:strand:+ start:800 stop:1291 length:492 start_codon:yes stop_codon:yes gene_type:complete
MKISFKEFCGLTKEEQNYLGANLNEDLSGHLKKKKMGELDKLLRVHDWWGFMSDDSRSYKKWKAEEEKIKALRDLVGDDAESLYKQYAKKAGVLEKKNIDIPTSEKVNEVKERYSIFPEQNVSTKNIQLGYGDGYVLPNKHHFVDTPFDTTTKWAAPPKNKYM